MAVAGGLLWYNSRPAQPQHWNTDALVAKESPTFGVGNDDRRIVFTYAVENTTNVDYQVDSLYGIKVLVRDKEDGFSQPLSEEVAPLRLPIFIPAKQKGEVTLSLTLSGIPVKEATEADAEYHERLRAYCNKHLANVAGFVLFDDTKRYQINLPRWLAEPRKTN